MRLFLAIEPPDTWRAAADAVRTALASPLAQASVPPSVLRWVAPERLHVTLRFLGGVEATMLDPLVAALARDVPPVDVTLALAHAGTFGGSVGGAAHRVHTVWLGVHDEGAALAPLGARIEHAVRAVGLPPDPRPLRAHVTLARVAPRAAPADRRAIAHAVAQLDPPPASATRFAEVTLLRSHLGTQPRYEPLARIG